MTSQSSRAIVAALSIASLSFGGSSGGSIGIAMIRGTATVDSVAVRGSATVLEGSVVQTGKGSTLLSLAGGARLSLVADTRSTIYRDHAVLEKGASQLQGGNGFPLFANDLHVVTSGANSVVRVSVGDAGKIQVAAVSGEARVLNSQGLLLAKVMPSLALEFEQQAAGVSMPRDHGQITGTLRKQGDIYLMTDDTSHITYQLLGAVPRDRVGKITTVAGTLITTQTPFTGADQILQVEASPGPAGMGAAHCGYCGHGHAILLVAGVGIASALGGFAAAGTFSDNSSPSH